MTPAENNRLPDYPGIPAAFFSGGRMFLPMVMWALLNLSGLANERPGIRLLQRQTTNQTTALQVMFRGGYCQAPAGKEGLEAILMEMIARGGPSGMDTVHYRYQLDSLQIRLGWDVQADYSLLTLECPSPNTSMAVQLLVQSLMTPRFDSRFFERIQEERINWLDHQEEDAEVRVANLSQFHYYRGTAYARPRMGTSTTVSALSLNELRTYAKNNLVKSAMSLYLVSPLGPDETDVQVAEPFSRLPLGLYQQADPPSVKKPESVGFQGVKDSSGTPVLFGYVSVPPLGDEQAGAASFFISSLLDQRLRQEFRFNRSLDVTVFGEYHFQRRPGVSVFIEGTECKTYAMILNGLFKSIRENGFSEEEVRQHRERLLSVYFSGLQENRELATHLRNWDYFAGLTGDDVLIEQLRRLTPSQLKSVWEKWFEPFHWTYIGLPSLLQAEDMKGK